MRATRALLYLDNLRNNIREVRKRVGPHRKICTAVKADAYGHGAVKISKTAIEEGVTHLGVATVSEGVELRAAGITAPVLLFGLPMTDEIKELVHNNLSPFVTDYRIIYLLNQEAMKQEKTIGIHLKVDTGMGRIGCSPDDVEDLCIYTSDKEGLRLDGVCTHFADADDREYTMKLIELFKRIIDNIKEYEIDPGIVHAANSNAILQGYEEAFFDMVRPGIMLYGYCPPFLYWQIRLKPVMSFRTKVLFIKKVNASTPISYGMTYKTEKETRIATLPIGYGDGYSSLLSGRGKVLINNRKYEISGRICMDQCMVDIGLNSSVNIYDDVILFGYEESATTAEDIATMIGTLPYEVLCLVSKRVPRIYI